MMNAALVERCFRRARGNKGCSANRHSTSRNKVRAMRLMTRRHIMTGDCHGNRTPPNSTPIRKSMALLVSANVPSQSIFFSPANTGVREWWLLSSGESSSSDSPTHGRLTKVRSALSSFQVSSCGPPTPKAPSPSDCVSKISSHYWGDGYGKGPGHCDES